MRPDPDAYAAFLDGVHEHQGILGRICTLFADSLEDRDDLRQEILLQAWKSFAGFRGDSTFSTWLYRVGINTALMGRRKRGRRRETPLEGADDERLAVHGCSEPDAEVERLQRCIRELPGLDRGIILLALERHSYEEIAAITGLSRGNVSVRLVRMKARLRERLEQLGRGEE